MPSKLLLLTLLLTTPAFAARQVSIAQLEQILGTSTSLSDPALAGRLAELELTQRLSPTQLARLQATVPGPASRQSLVILAGMSAFSDPPASEIPSTPTPDVATERRIIALAAIFAQKTISHLPNFFATRNTLLFEDTPHGFQRASLDEPLHPIGSASDPISYRDGREVVDTARRSAAVPTSSPNHLATAGVFGPALGTVLVDIAHGTIAWLRWEQGPTGNEAVFSYAIPLKQSHYEITVPGAFQQKPAYSGTLTIDPVTGSILRLTLQARLSPANPVSRSDIAIDYGPVEISGKTYICPLQSISVWVAPPPIKPDLFSVYSDIQRFDANGRQTSLNIAHFVDYHVFRAESRILAGNQPPPPPASTLPLPSTPPPTTPVAAAPTASAILPTPPATRTAAVTTASVISPPAPAVVTPSPITPPPIPQTPSAPIPTLRVNAHLVDVDVVVRDRRGRLVPGLTAADFHVFEDGTPQTIDSFRAVAPNLSPSGAATPRPGQTTSTSPNPATQPDSPPDTTSLILLDLLDTSPTNQTTARNQLLKFLGTLPTGHRIALFLLAGNQLRLVQPPTTDPALLASSARSLLSQSSPLFQSATSERHSKDIIGTMPGLATPGGQDASMLADLANEVSTENAQHGQARNSIVQAALRSLENAASKSPGRTNLFWLAETFPSNTAPGLFENRPNTRIAIYPISVLGLESNTISAQDTGNSVNFGSPGSGAEAAPLSEHQSNRDNLRASMEQIAARTGGVALFGNNDLAAALRQGLTDAETFYSLSYVPTDKLWNNRFRTIQVKLAQGHDALSYRQGYLATPNPSPDSSTTPSQTKPQPQP